MKRLSSAPICGLIVGTIASICSCSVASAGNIVLIGFWPPTNEMLRQFSTSPVKNPEGWMGQNWNGLGHDVYAFFPEFPPDGDPFNDPFGSPGYVGSPESDFRVDYQDTSADFWDVMDTLNPRGIITFSWGGDDDRWEIERVEGGHFGGSTPEFDWIGDGNGVLDPTQATIDPRSWDAISIYRDGNRLQSQLPVDDIVSATSALNLANVFIDETETSGNFLSGFLGLHGLYYNSLHNDPNDPFWNIAAGHIHVGSGLPVADARLLSEVTLNQTLLFINHAVPEPSSFVLAALGAVVSFALRKRGRLCRPVETEAV
jgi:hypothetical protein